LGSDAPKPDGIVSAAGRCGLPLEIVAIRDPEIARLYERKLVLVRPDGHVAWRSDQLPTDPDGLIDQVRGAGMRAPRASASRLEQRRNRPKMPANTD
jgi:hypothetical protein